MCTHPISYSWCIGNQFVAFFLSYYHNYIVNSVYIIYNLNIDSIYAEVCTHKYIYSQSFNPSPLSQSNPIFKSQMRQRSQIEMNRRIQWNQSPPNVSDYSSECLQSTALGPFHQGEPVGEDAEVPKKRSIENSGSKVSKVPKKEAPAPDREPGLVSKSMLFGNWWPQQISPKQLAVQNHWRIFEGEVHFGRTMKVPKVTL